MEKAAKILKNGRNQAVRLPVQFEFDHYSSRLWGLTIH